MTFKAVVLAVAALLGITACAPPEPVRLGFIGGLSGRVADLGEAGRNGALLAVEDANAAGGIDGRKVELLVHDDEQKVDIAIREAESLAAARVAAIIGPMTSSMGEAILPTVSRAGLVTVSPTITTSTLSAKDDLLFKVAPSSAESTRRSAAFEYARGARRVAIVYDLSNRAFTADWAGHFRNAFVALGGSVVAESTFTSGDDAGYVAAVKNIAASRADLLLFVASAVDTVRLTRLARNQGLRQPVTTSTWAATEHLVDFGGRTVEGITMTQFFNRDDASQRYRAFADAYRARFKMEPGFAGVASYDTTRAVLVALARAGKTVPLKEALIAAGPYEGLQERWHFDRFGDAARQTRIAVVRDGRIVVVD
jgi:branched-chain amino acid transport system substrate-binding protein